MREGFRTIRLIAPIRPPPNLHAPGEQQGSAIGIAPQHTPYRNIVTIRGRGRPFPPLEGEARGKRQNCVSPAVAIIRVFQSEILL